MKAIRRWLARRLFGVAMWIHPDMGKGWMRVMTSHEEWEVPALRVTDAKERGGWWPLWG